MIRDVELESYLPEYLKGYREIANTLKAENPEFKLLWENVDRLLKNCFIDTADEYGISRMEKMIGITPSDLDTLETRRIRVQALWWNPTPYTIRAFIKKLEELCKEGSFEVDKSRLEEYFIGIRTNLWQYGEVDSLRRLVNGMVPANMRVEILNEIVTQTCAAIAYAGTALAVRQKQQIDNDVHLDGDMYFNPFVHVAMQAELYETFIISGVTT